jgi:hypothetical protein
MAEGRPFHDLGWTAARDRDPVRRARGLVHRRLILFAVVSLVAHFIRRTPVT